MKKLVIATIVIALCIIASILQSQQSTKETIIREKLIITDEYGNKKIVFTAAHDGAIVEIKHKETRITLGVGDMGAILDLAHDEAETKRVILHTKHGKPAIELHHGKSTIILLFDSNRTPIIATVDKDGKIKKVE